jgi:potassium efflux system protein
MSLAHISHQLSAVAGDAPHPAGFSRFGVLDVLSKTTPRRSDRKPYWALHLAALATQPGEIGGLDSGTSQLTSALDTPLFSIGTTEVTGALLVTAVLIVIATVVLSLLLRRWVVRVFEKRGSTNDDTIGSYGKAAQVLVTVIGVGIALHTIGINMTSIFAAGGIFALGMGFAVKNIAENLISGVMLRLEHAISLGDVIQVKGEMVKVTHLGTRSTTVRTMDDQDMLIPNSTLMQSIVTNYTLRDPRYRLSIQIEVPPSADLDQVRTTLEETAKNLEWRVPDRDPEVFLESPGEPKVTYQVAVWIDDPWTAPQRQSDFNEAVRKSLNV